MAAGYQSIGDGRASGFEHFINAEYLANPTILDAGEVESLVYRLEADGSKTLTTAMYMLPPGATTDDVPDIAGNLTVWHAHDNLCFAPGPRSSRVPSSTASVVRAVSSVPRRRCCTCGSSTMRAVRSPEPIGVR